MILEDGTRAPIPGFFVLDGDGVCETGLDLAATTAEALRDALVAAAVH